MNESFLFYWLSWLLIIIIYFFMEKSNLKSYFLFVMFLIIITMNWNIVLYELIYIQIAFIIILFSSFVYYARFSITFYQIATTLTVMVGYVSLQIWAKVAPIWYVIHPYVIIPFIVVCLMMILNQKLLEQIAICTISLSLGHLIFRLILISYHLYHNVIDEQFFILLFITYLFIVLVHFSSMIVNFLKLNKMNN